VRLERLVARGFRNLADLDVAVPAAGMLLLGENGQGKTNLLEALCYTVLCRSIRGAADAELVQFAGTGFRVATWGSGREVSAQWNTGERRKRIAVEGAEAGRLADAIGSWLAVAFLPGDVALASGPAAGRRLYLDRLLALADQRYLGALARYRAALAQRNAALRQGRGDLASAFDQPLAEAGSCIVRSRLAWVTRMEVAFESELAALGERTSARLLYRGHPELARQDAWPALLAEQLPRDLARTATGMGPHRDDLRLLLDGRDLRTFGSTGQQRTAAVALRLLELRTLAEDRGTEPALALDDVFAELDGERQERLAHRLLAGPERQVFLTAPRAQELPAGLALPVWRVSSGRVAA
jgi:DNA replication and repair protein RecF